jgi:anti-anti-sigma regulatory factor
MMSRLNVTVTESGEVSQVKLAGVIDEDNGLSELASKVTKNMLVVNVAEVVRINSCGVRDWVSWLNLLRKKGVALVLAECSPALMTQVHLVNNFVGGCAIFSFYAPYFCTACNAERMVLFEVAEMQRMPTPAAPTRRCDQCDQIMEFDDIEADYFSFLQTKQPVTDRALIDLLRGQRGARVRDRSLTAAALTPTATGSLGSRSGSIPPTFTPSDRVPKPTLAVAPERSSRTPTLVLYVIIGLLVTAIVLLGYLLIVRS